MLGGKGLERLGKREYYIIRRYVEKRERVRSNVKMRMSKDVEMLRQDALSVEV